MSMQDIARNIKVIQNSRVIPTTRKQNLLLTQLQTINVLFLDHSNTISLQEREEAQRLSDEIQFFLESSLIQIC